MAQMFANAAIRKKATPKTMIVAAFLFGNNTRKRKRVEANAREEEPSPSHSEATSLTFLLNGNKFK